MPAPGMHLESHGGIRLSHRCDIHIIDEADNLVSVAAFSKFCPMISHVPGEQVRTEFAFIEIPAFQHLQPQHLR